VDGLTWAVELGLGLLALALHLMAIAFTRALRTYSRSRACSSASSARHCGSSAALPRGNNKADGTASDRNDAQGAALTQGTLLFGACSNSYGEEA